MKVKHTGTTKTVCKVLGKSTCHEDEYVRLPKQKKCSGTITLQQSVYAVPPNGGELSLLLHLLSKNLELLLEWFFVVVGVDIIIVWHHR